MDINEITKTILTFIGLYTVKENMVESHELHQTVSELMEKAKHLIPILKVTDDDILDEIMESTIISLKALLESEG